MCFLKDVPMGAPDSTMGDPLLLNGLIEMLRNGQGENITRMVQEVSLKVFFYKSNYLTFCNMLC